MNDPLEQLLRDTDSSISIPEIDAELISQRVRCKARNQRRMAACGLAILLLIVGLLLCRPLLSTQTQIAVAPTLVHQIVPVASAMDRINGALHERTAMLLQQAELQRRATSHATDEFLFELQLNRDRAALVLLNDATHKQTDNPVAAALQFRRTIDLFPETPAAQTAAKLLAELEPSMRRS
jgi:type II secretory pathway component PulM